MVAYEPNVKQLRLARWIREQKRKARRREELKLLEEKKQTMPDLKDIQIIYHSHGMKTTVYRFEKKK